MQRHTTMLLHLSVSMQNKGALLTDRKRKSNCLNCPSKHKVEFGSGRKAMHAELNVSLSLWIMEMQAKGLTKNRFLLVAICKFP